MGLDSYLFKRGRTAKGKIIQALDEKSGKHGYIELAYWRKSYELHEKFLSYAINLIKSKAKLYSKKQAVKSAKELFDLNCKNIPLEKEDLQQILIWVKEMLSENDKEDGDKLDGYQTEDFELAKQVIEKALKETDFENEEICYYSWW